jgi:hypothetical protein
VRKWAKTWADAAQHHIQDSACEELRSQRIGSDLAESSLHEEAGAAISAALQGNPLIRHGEC